MSKNQPAIKKIVTKNKTTANTNRQNTPPKMILGEFYLYTCHNWSTGNVVVKELSKVGQIWREAGADLDLIVTVMDHITHPPGAREGVAVYTFNPRHFDP